LPIYNFLNRLRWDPRFREGRFEIGYYDRLLNRILVVSLETIRFSAAAPLAFELYDGEGTMHRIPFHRVRRVYRNGQIIWQRKLVCEHPQDTARR
jgi:uncharacterized protein (UPF0248 family)